MRTLAELKRYLQPSVKVLRVESYGKPIPEEDQPREVVKVQTNAVVFKTPKHSKSWLEWGPASLIEIDDDGFSMYLAGLREMTEDERRVYEGRPQDKEQSMRDAMTDGSVMFYREKHYFAECKYPYLRGMDMVQGKKYDFRTGQIIDNTIKGECLCRYKFVK